MTPELKQACELIFQEHKTSVLPIDWNKNIFHGRIAFHLSALAKQTLEKRNIICTVNGRKKSSTVLNPDAASAASFEEAEEIILNKYAVATTEKGKTEPEYILHQVAGEPIDISNTDKKAKTLHKPGIAKSKIRRSNNSFYYFTLLLAAAIAGAIFTYLIGLLA
jgi:hypothetical protein